MTPWLFVITALIPWMFPGETAEGLVALSDQRAVIDPDAEGGPLLTFTATAHSRAPAPVEVVDIGILFGDEADALAGVNAAAAYRDPPLRPAIGVERRQVPVTLPAGGSVPVELAVRFPAKRAPPVAFLVHVLGYRLAQVRASDLFLLLRTGAAPDEVAAVTALGLDQGPSGKRAARLRLAGDSDLVADLVAYLAAPIPERPTHGDTLTRVFAVLSLGVLGGDEARRALDGLASRPLLSALDEPLQVLRATRLSTSRLEAPTAFAIPVEARVMSDVVALAIRDLEGWPETIEPVGELEATEAEVLDPPARDWLALVAAFGAGLFVFVAVWWLLRRLSLHRR